MPVYEYRCKRCRTLFTRTCAMSRRNEPAPCPECGGPGAKVISVPTIHQGVWQRPRTAEELRTTEEIWE